jgi:predicted transcriptional regulator
MCPQSIGEARLRAVELRKEHPMMTLEEIGEHCGVTKQRVFRIFKDEGIPKRPTIGRQKRFTFCRGCDILTDNGLFCSPKCREEVLFTELPCNTCGKLVKHKQYEVLRKLKKGQYNFFCNRRCFHIKQRNSK